MAISLKSWVSGEVLKASDADANLEAMKNKAQKLSNTDLKTGTTWVTTSHIMQPRFDVLTNVSNNVSGVFGGRNNGGTFQNMSFVTRWLSPTAYAGTSRNQIVPLTNIQIDLTHPHTIFFQWWINHQSAFDADGTDGETRFFCYRNNQQITGIGHRVPEQKLGNKDPTGTASVMPPALVNGQFNTNGHILFDSNVQTLNFGIGLNAWSSAGKCQQMAWGVSIECFYM